MTAASYLLDTDWVIDHFNRVEAVTRRRIKPGVEKLIHAAGMAVLLGLMAVVTVNDVVRLTGAGSLVGLVQKVWPF